jgi:hypothetical protein
MENLMTKRQLRNVTFLALAAAFLWSGAAARADACIAGSWGDTQSICEDTITKDYACFDYYEAGPPPCGWNVCYEPTSETAETCTWNASRQRWESVDTWECQPCDPPYPN